MQKKAATTSTSKSGAKPESKAPVKAHSSTAKAHPAKVPAAKAAAADAAADLSEGIDQAAAGSDKSAPAKKAVAAAKAKPKGDRAAFLDRQRQLLLDERANYLRSADALKAQADSLALEHEPGDVQFDEEGGEGGTANVDREMDLVLSAQARAAATEIDRALAKIEAGTYGVCEQCGRPIPDARLEALPYATLCVACKSGGLSARR
jgi:RNA polymerase-binding transcription factor